MEGGKKGKGLRNYNLEASKKALGEILSLVGSGLSLRV